MTCGESNPNTVFFELEQRQEVPNSRGLCNYFAKCKGCERSGSIEFLEGTQQNYTDQGGEWKSIAHFECRGIEIEEFVPHTSFTALAAKSDTTWGNQG
jgi:hypothetical protein